MKKIVFIIILLLFGAKILLFAQTDDISILDKKLSFNVFKYWGFMTKEHNIISSGLFYGIVNFQNDNLLSNAIEMKYGAKLTVFPLILEGYKFSGKVKIADMSNTPVYQSIGNSLEHSGQIFSASVCPLPYINQKSEIFVPYVGIGYQLSELGFGEVEKKDFDRPLRSSYLNSSAWTWKTGCIIYLKKLPVSLVIDYEQSWKSKNEVIKFNRINFGIFVDIMKYNYKDRIKMYLPH
ncbi:MAG: hypothetical protein LBS55_09135 [Prevotellaceae bacterium]|jgi:hypothetical protein|nr:hypothetical protein [Prevotellaceae bacterium]